MNKRIRHSYKIKDDSLEEQCKQLIQARISSARLRKQLTQVQHSLEQANALVAENEEKVIYLMKAKHKKGCVVNRVSFELHNDELSISLVLD